MAWFDDPFEFYRETLDETVPVSQGDIVIAPTAVIMHGVAGADVAAPADLDSVREVTLWRAAEEVNLPRAPSLSAQIRWGLAMVLPHPCALEKEWNERVYELTSAGVEPQLAQTQASEDPELDKYVSIAPILLYSGIPEARVIPISRGDVLGTFPIVAHGHIPAAYVDLAQISTVRWELLATSQRVAGLTEVVAAHLRHRLATTFAYRAKSKLGTVEAAVGQRIVEVSATPTARKLTVSLILENGTTLVLEGDRHAEAAPGPERPARA